MTGDRELQRTAGDTNKQMETGAQRLRVRKMGSEVQ